MSDLAQKFYNASETFKSFNNTGKKEAILLSYSSIVHAAIDPSSASAKQSLVKINSSLVYRRQYRQVLQAISLSFSPKQVAASTENALFERKNNEFTMVIESAVETDSVVIHITLNETVDNDATHLNMHCFYDDVILPLTMERQSNSGFSAMVSTKNMMYTAITNADSEIFIN